jgi:2-polyprenyl-3-methyl-5-hydroxy-6-metoxy-1,4-benzoquinol methylase
VHANYAQRYRTLWERHWWWRSREAFVLAWIADLQRRASLKRILDVGCGDGLFFDALSRFGEVDGLEPDATLLTDPRWRSRIHVGAIERGCVLPEQYDLVLMLDVLEHIADESEALAKLRATLRPGGYALLTVPALPWLWSRHDDANAHHRRYRKAKLSAALVRVGFEIETLRYFFVWTVAPLWARRVLAPAGRGTADYEVSIPHPAINRALSTWSCAEHALSRFVSWPIGSSLLAIVRRPSESAAAAA